MKEVRSDIHTRVHYKRGGVRKLYKSRLQKRWGQTVIRQYMKEVGSDLIPNWVKIVVNHFRLIFDSCKRKLFIKTKKVNKFGKFILLTNNLEKPVQPLDHSY